MSYASVVLAKNPYVWYRFDEVGGTTVTDASGNGRHGSYVNTPTLEVASADANLGTAVSFNGTNEYVNCGSGVNGFGAEVGTGWTAEMWINTTTASTPDCVFGVFNDGGTTSFQLQLNFSIVGTGQLNTHRVYQRSENGTSAEFTFESSTLRDGNWHHLVIAALPQSAASASTRLVWLDGVALDIADGSGAMTTGTIAFGYELTIAADNSRGSIGNHGEITIDEFALYPTVLTTTDVQENFDAAFEEPFVSVAGAGSTATRAFGAATVARPLSASGRMALLVSAAGQAQREMTGSASLANAAVAAASALRSIQGHAPSAITANAAVSALRQASARAAMAISAFGFVVVPIVDTDTSVSLATSRVRERATVGAGRQQWVGGESRAGWAMDSNRVGWAIDPNNIERGE